MPVSTKAVTSVDIFMNKKVIISALEGKKDWERKTLSWPMSMKGSGWVIYVDSSISNDPAFCSCSIKTYERCQLHLWSLYFQVETVIGQLHTFSALFKRTGDNFQPNASFVEHLTFTYSKGDNIFWKKYLLIKLHIFY